MDAGLKKDPRQSRGQTGDLQNKDCGENKVTDGQRGGWEHK